MRKALTVATIVAVVLFVSAAASAQTVLDAVDSGHYSWEGDHTPTNLNYIAGNPSGAYNEIRDFIAFDLSGVTERIDFATLELYNPGNPPDSSDGYTSSDPTETFTLFEVSTSPATVVAGGTGLTSIFDDLGGGLVFAAVEVSAADNGSIVEIPLRSEAIQSLNQADGLWIVGGTLTTMTGTRHEYVFGGTDGTMTRRLLINVVSPVFANGFESGDPTGWSSWTH